MPSRKSPFADASPVFAQPLRRTLDRQRPTTQRFTLRLPQELVEKVRTAWLVDGVPQGIRSVSAWVGEILQAEIDRIERSQGPLPGTPPGVVPSGWDAHQPAQPRPAQEYAE